MLPLLIVVWFVMYAGLVLPGMDREEVVTRYALVALSLGEAVYLAESAVRWWQRRELEQLLMWIADQEAAGHITLDLEPSDMTVGQETRIELPTDLAAVAKGMECEVPSVVPAGVLYCLSNRRLQLVNPEVGSFSLVAGKCDLAELGLIRRRISMTSAEVCVRSCRRDGRR